MCTLRREDVRNSINRLHDTCANMNCIEGIKIDLRHTFLFAHTQTSTSTCSQRRRDMCALVNLPVDVLVRMIALVDTRHTRDDGTRLVEQLAFAFLMCETCTHMRAAATAWKESIRRFVLLHPKVDDTSASILGFHFPNLRHIELSGTRVGDSGVVAIVNRCVDLTYVALSQTVVGDIGVAAIGARCPRLTHVELSETRVGDNGVCALAQGCPLLAYVDLSFTFVFDTAIEALAAGCPLLTHVYLRQTQVSDAGIEVLAAKCPMLTHVELARVGDSGVAALAGNEPRH